MINHFTLTGNDGRNKYEYKKVLQYIFYKEYITTNV